MYVPMYICMYACKYVCTYVLIYEYIYVWLYVGVDYTYIDVNTLAQCINIFWPDKFGFNLLLWHRFARNY